MPARQGDGEHAARAKDPARLGERMPRIREVVEHVEHRRQALGAQARGDAPMDIRDACVLPEHGAGELESAGMLVVIGWTMLGP